LEISKHQEDLLFSQGYNSYIRNWKKTNDSSVDFILDENPYENGIGSFSDSWSEGAYSARLEILDILSTQEVLHTYES
jgi:hypothetical protein